jgi:hypothetical protein
MDLDVPNRQGGRFKNCPDLAALDLYVTVPLASPGYDYFTDEVN